MQPTVVTFMLRLKKIDNANLTSRDIMVLWALHTTPGMMGQEVSKKLGFEVRSRIQYVFDRLIREGYIEDRRIIVKRKAPNNFFILPKGRDFITDLLAEPFDA